MTDDDLPPHDEEHAEHLEQEEIEKEASEEEGEEEEEGGDVESLEEQEEIVDSNAIAKLSEKCKTGMTKLSKLHCQARLVYEILPSKSSKNKKKNTQTETITHNKIQALSKLLYD